MDLNLLPEEWRPGRPRWMRTLAVAAVLAGVLVGGEQLAVLYLRMSALRHQVRQLSGLVHNLADRRREIAALQSRLATLQAEARLAGSLPRTYWHEVLGAFLQGGGVRITSLQAAHGVVQVGGQAGNLTALTRYLTRVSSRPRVGEVTVDQVSGAGPVTFTLTVTVHPGDAP